MNKQDQVRYLANIYHLLIADGEADPVEEKAFDQISRDIGAGYFQKKDAEELARGEGYEVQFVGRWSDRIRNLEDMILAAYCNGVLERTERKLITQYAVQVGINQAQFDVIKQETRKRYAEFKATVP
jgi:uncharacterized tellurite resistance protein B-like protein